jgi:rhodanese-related sulfurtransferase
MVRPLKIGYRRLLEEAAAKVRSVTPEEAQAMAAEGKAVIVDIRDIRELEREGRIPGSFHAPRGMLEFWVDPESPYFKPVFGEEKSFVLHCASGWRSLLATEQLQAMGLDVVDLKGGFAAWKGSDLPVEPLTKK